MVSCGPPSSTARGARSNASIAHDPHAARHRLEPSRHAGARLGSGRPSSAGRPEAHPVVGARMARPRGARAADVELRWDAQSHRGRSGSRLAAGSRRRSAPDDCRLSANAARDRLRARSRRSARAGRRGRRHLRRVLRARGRGPRSRVHPCGGRGAARRARRRAPRAESARPGRGGNARRGQAPRRRDSLSPGSARPATIRGSRARAGDRGGPPSTRRLPRQQGHRDPPRRRMAQGAMRPLDSGAGGAPGAPAAAHDAVHGRRLVGRARVRSAVEPRDHDQGGDGGRPRVARASPVRRRRIRARVRRRASVPGGGSGRRVKVTGWLVGALWLGALVVIGGSAYLQVVEERRLLSLELGRRAAVLGEGLKEAVQPAMARAMRPSGIERVLRRFGKPEQGVAVYDRTGTLEAATPEMALSLPPSLPEVTDAMTTGMVQRGLRSVGGRVVYVYVTPVIPEDRPIGALAVFLDASGLGRAEWERWRFNAIRFVVLGFVLSLIAWLIVRRTVTRPMAKMVRWTNALRRGQTVAPTEFSDADLFGPVAREVTVLAKSLHRAQAAAQEEATLRLIGESLWTEERLKQFARLRLGESPLVVVSNREPVRHVRREGRIVAETPASGLVTAMDPVMRACGGVWVAQGNGDADREMADARGRLLVPPDDPRYTLRRVWLTRQEEAGYYEGFANEGLWPLCHIVHTRPLFRPDDWAHYRAVNEKFATAVLEEIAKTESPMVLLQDYHFALLPLLVKRERPDAKTAIFWHIPWPNFEHFSICPWQEELLLGMLGADLIGFHTQYYCNNFLDTVERAIEGRTDWERFSVTRGRHTTYVKPFPISVAPDFVEDPPDVSRQALLERLGIETRFIGIGVERLDYTKGLPERFRAIGRFFERFPAYRERLVYVQLAAPSRSTIPRYQQLEAEVDEMVQAINARHGTKRWRPITYLKRHHDHREIWPLYRHGDFCMVTSLHDGMNLVAKEFVSTRDDDDGVLILSRFTGAAAELSDALLVNPYDLDGTADAILTAVEMSPEERRARMARMRRSVREQNIYRWAGLLLSDLSRIPEEPSVSALTT